MPRVAINETAEALLALDGVAEVYSVAGEGNWPPSPEPLAEIVTRQMLKMDGIVHTKILIAFRVHSKDDRHQCNRGALSPGSTASPNTTASRDAGSSEELKFTGWGARSDSPL